jgi:GT2 family glycosyltransferase
MLIAAVTPSAGDGPAATLLKRAVRGAALVGWLAAKFAAMARTVGRLPTTRAEWAFLAGRFSRDLNAAVGRWLSADRRPIDAHAHWLNNRCLRPPEVTSDTRITIVRTAEEAEAATTEFVLSVGPESQPEPDAAAAFAGLLDLRPDLDAAYGDEWIADTAGRVIDADLKPDYSPALFGDPARASGVVLRRRVPVATNLHPRVAHIPVPLSTRRTDGTPSLARRAGEEPGVGAAGKVSIVIPTKDKVHLLRRCIESIERLTEYRGYEITVIDNGSRERETLDYLAGVQPRVRVMRVESGPEGFNYSRLNNTAARAVDGEWLLLLNNDTEVRRGEWLTAMLNHAAEPGVGCVGAKLLYPDGRIQHAGVLVDVCHGKTDTAGRFEPGDHPGPLGYFARQRDYSAVTAACLLVRRSLYLEMGGLDETNFAVAYNDIDFCLRLRERGLRCVYEPRAELTHYESVSRGPGLDCGELERFVRKWGGRPDPYYNPNLSGTPPYFRIDTRRRRRELRPQNESRKLREGDGLQVWLSRPRRLPEWAERLIADLARRDGLSLRDSPDGADAALAFGVGGWRTVEEAWRRNRTRAVWCLPGLSEPFAMSSDRPWAEWRSAVAALPRAYRVVFASHAAAGCWSPWNTVGNFDVVPVGADRDAIQALRDGQRGSLRAGRGLSPDELLALTAGPPVRLRVGGVRTEPLAEGPAGRAEQLAAADVLVWQGTAEPGDPRVVEAMSAGVMVLSAHLSAEAMLDGDVGLTFPLGDGAALSGLLSALSADRKRLDRFRRQARSWADTLPTWSDTVREFAERLSEAAELSGSPGE